MNRGRERQIGTSASSPAVARAELAARVDDVVRAFVERVPESVPCETVEALRAGVLELARAHAARTVLETITERQANRGRGSLHRRP